jgi:hypothetical protein
VFQTRIRRNIKLAEASSFGQSVFEYAARSNGALDYADLTDEIFGAAAVLTSRAGLKNGEKATVDSLPETASRDGVEMPHRERNGRADSIMVSETVGQPAQPLRRVH